MDKSTCTLRTKVEVISGTHTGKIGQITVEPDIYGAVVVGQDLTNPNANVTEPINVHHRDLDIVTYVAKGGSETDS